MKNMQAICFHCVSKHTQEHSVSKCLRTLGVKGIQQSVLYCLCIIYFQIEKVYYVLYVLEYTHRVIVVFHYASFHSLPQRKVNAYKRLHK